MADPLGAIATPLTTSTSDQVFDTLYRAMITFQLEPGSKISEAEIAKNLGVSRQPVRDAFFRLSKVGFLSIRPQRATLVTRITEHRVFQAAFLRTALEASCIRDLALTRTDQDITELKEILSNQGTADTQGDRASFHTLDDHLHERMCQMSGHGYAWPLIEEQKAHIDRVRFLSLSYGRQTTFSEHCDIVSAIEAKDARAAEEQLREHLGHIKSIVPLVRSNNPQYFEDSGQ